MSTIFFTPDFVLFCSFSPPSESRNEDIQILRKKAKLEFSPINEKDTTLNKTLEFDITCPESTALLHTPLVARTIKQKVKEATTPHSILKVTNYLTVKYIVNGRSSLNKLINTQGKINCVQKTACNSYHITILFILL